MYTLISLYVSPRRRHGMQSAHCTDGCHRMLEAAVVTVVTFPSRIDKLKKWTKLQPNARTENREAANEDEIKKTRGKNIKSF